MAIVYKNGRLIRETNSGYTDEEVQAIIDSAIEGSATGKAKLPKGTRDVLTTEQGKSRAAFEANAQKEGQARALAEKNRLKLKTAYDKKDSDGDGIPNAIDKEDNTPLPRNENNNMPKNPTPVKNYINQQLRAAGLPDTPSNRASLRKEYMEIQETQKAETIKAEAAAAKADKKIADNKTTFDAIMKSIGGYENRAGVAKTDAMKRLADLYDPQISALDTQKQNQLNFLQQVLSQAGTDIDASEQNFLSNIKNPTAYNDVPLINMPQQQNALMAALQSQGADTGQVAAQSAADASMNNFMQQLLARSNQQYGNAQTNYVDALRNAGMGAAKSGRDYLSLQQPRLASDINSKFADALADLNTNRANSESNIMESFQKALTDAANKKVDAETDYPQFSTVAPPADMVSDMPSEDMSAVDDLGMTEEERKKLQEALAGFGGFGQGFLIR